MDYTEEELIEINLSKDELYNRAVENSDVQDLYRAAEKGHPEAQYSLGINGFVKGHYNKAAKWFEMVVQNTECEHAQEAQKYLDTIQELSAE